MISSTSGHVGYHGGRRHQGLEGVHQVVDEIIFLSCYTSFQPSFWRGIDCKWFHVPQGHVGYHGGRRHQGQGGVLQVVYENIFCNIIHTSFLPIFFTRNRLQMISSTQGYFGHHGGRRHQGQGGVYQGLLDTTNANYSEGNFLTVYTQNKR